MTSVGRSPSPEPVRHMAPGYVGSCCWNSEGGAFVVLRANRGGAKHWLSEEQGLAALADYYGVPTSAITGRATRQEWRNVLARECSDGFHDAGCGVDDCEQGNYCHAGSGARWVEVLGITHTAAGETAPARTFPPRRPRIGPIRQRIKTEVAEMRPDYEADRQTWPLVLSEALVRLLCLVGVYSICRHFGFPEWTVIPSILPAYAAVEVFRYQAQVTKR